MINRKFDPKKIKTFVEDALRDYKSHLIVNEICNLRETKETDGSFTQIGIRPLVDADMLLPNRGGVAFDPRLPAIGMTVANGEQDFLIKNILDKIKKRIPLKKLEGFQKEIYDFNNPKILISLKFFVQMHKEFIQRIKYVNNKTILDNLHEIDFIPERDLGNRILIIDEGAISWTKQKFKNKVTGTGENLDIQIKPHNEDKIDILVRSVNKMKILDKEGIKVLEVEENES